MASQTAQHDPDAELEAAFHRHLPQRLKTLMRRARAQCRSGWDCNVARALHDEIAQLAGACGRYGMLEPGERLQALETALAPAVAAGGVPDAAAAARIDGLLDSLRPHLQQTPPAPGGWTRTPAGAAATGPFPRAEVPPPGYWTQLGVADPGLATIAAPAANEPVVAPPSVPDGTRAPRVSIVNDDDPLLNELLLRLDQKGCEVVLQDSLDGLLDELQRAPPELSVAVIDARTRLDPLAIALRAARQDPAHRVRLLLLLRGGDVDLRLRALRTGADRCIALPVNADTVVATALELAAVDEEGPYRVLIVDDDPAQSLFAQAILRRAGMETRILAESLPVLDELDRFQPDLLLLDLNMPDCDGFELTALIRERAGYVNTPIVFLSGELDEDRQFAALDAGADDFLLKPIRPTHLVAAVTNRIRRARAANTSAHRRRRQAAAGGMHARPQLFDALTEHLSASAGAAQRGGLLAVEVDDATRLRARIGPAAFERVLTQVGEFLAGRAGGGMVIARHGDAGFLLFAATHDEDGLAALASQMLAAVGDLRFGARAFALRLRCAVYALAAEDEAAGALAAVERTLSAARARGDHLVRHSQLAAEPAAVGERLRAALATGALALVFQPVIPIRGAALPQYQALLRLHADGHEYRAGELVAAAIQAGSIARVDGWVIERCLAILAGRRDADPVRLFASQSLAGWREGARCNALAQLLADAGIAAGALVLEFRHEEARADPRVLVGLAPRLREAGVKLALAGVDREALAAEWLERLPLDYLKLQPALAGAELADVVRVAHARGQVVVAPRVETLAAAEALRATQVDLLQGNYFRAPAPGLESMVAEGGT
ncbi:MAG TPA: response regulator [Rhodanobacteraceae bacterium]|nr:response regulator [Rhodanobacteraceae bacterium]